jgi:hypothetical protein
MSTASLNECLRLGPSIFAIISYILVISCLVSYTIKSCEIDMPTRSPPKRNFLLLTWNNLTLGAPKNENLVDRPVCKKMAEDLARAYFSHWNAKSVRGLVSKVCKDSHKSSYQPVSVAWTDYIAGAAHAINPLPPTISTSYVSDVDALHSDWTSVWSDLDAVWTTASRLQVFLENASDDEHERSESDPNSAKSDGRSA